MIPTGLTAKLGQDPTWLHRWLTYKTQVQGHRTSSGQHQGRVWTTDAWCWEPLPSGDRVGARGGTLAQRRLILTG